MSDVYTEIDAYFERNFLRTDEVLEKISASSADSGLVPHAVTRLQAAFLALLLKMIGARRVLEIGCLGGYSAVAMARALPPGGTVLTTEIDARTAQIAQANIEAAGYADRITLEVGPAMATLEREIAKHSVFDFVFIDADKTNHKNYLAGALKLTRPGSLIVADNIVRGGGVLETQSEDNSIKGVREMIAYASTLKTVEMTALQTVGEKGYDGMALFRVTE
ncbi:MAG: class I SAM-dependent methyltransferase [Pseudomonadota bacterium]